MKPHHGDSIVLIHGWGLHGGLWHRVVPALEAAGWRVHCVDLPGHGRSAWPGVPADGDVLDAFATPVAAELDALGITHPVVIGWSLGGMVALRLAQRRQVRALGLVGATPRFISAPDWPHGMAPAAFTRFAAHLAQDWSATVNEFLGLQARGAENERELLRELHATAFAHGQPDPAALQAGLRVLAEVDLRAALPLLTVPVWVAGGERDRLSSPGAAAAIAQAVRRATHVTFARAGHAPFLSHAPGFNAALLAFLDDLPAQAAA